MLPPAAFGAVHVLGQMGMGGMGMGGMGGGMGMGGMGGGMGMGGMGGGMVKAWRRHGNGRHGWRYGHGWHGRRMGMGGMGMGGGMFRIAPDRPTKLTVPCVCLEHGKLDPTPRMTYKVVPLNRSPDPRLPLCSLLGQGLVPQNTAQAAAWHMANGLSWDELAVKNRIESRYTGNVRFFSRLELQAAYRAATSIDQWVAESQDQAAEDRSVGYAIEE